VGGVAFVATVVASNAETICDSSEKFANASVASGAGLSATADTFIGYNQATTSVAGGGSVIVETG
jgi:hypothetical protein